MEQDHESGLHAEGRPERMVRSVTVKGEDNMIIRHTYIYAVMVSGMLLFGGCAFKNYEARDEIPSDSTLKSQSSTLAGSYKDIGSNGSIKPHPESSYKTSQESQSQTEGVIVLGGEAKELPDLRTGTMKRESGRKTPSSGPSPNSTGSSNR
jgi:hypothetical protein